MRELEGNGFSLSTSYTKRSIKPVAIESCITQLVRQGDGVALNIQNLNVATYKILVNLHTYDHSFPLCCNNAAFKILLEPLR